MSTISDDCFGCAIVLLALALLTIVAGVVLRVLWSLALIGWETLG